MLRLLRCRFWKSEPSRGPPGASPASAGISILMTLAPQSASWRTQVGPERTRVRSRTVKRERASEALVNGISTAPEWLFGPERAFWRPTFPDLPGLVHHGKRAARNDFIHHSAE